MSLQTSNFERQNKLGKSKTLFFNLALHSWFTLVSNHFWKTFNFVKVWFITNTKFLIKKLPQMKPPEMLCVNKTKYFNKINYFWNNLKVKRYKGNKHFKTIWHIFNLFFNLMFKVFFNKYSTFHAINTINEWVFLQILL